MNTIPMNDVVAQYQRYKPDIDNAVLQTIQSGIYIGGDQVKIFEAELAKYLGVKHVISCANGTDALMVALMSLDLPRGSEIITSPFTFASTVEVILFCGYKVIFADINPKTFNLDPLKVEEKITSNTRAIIPVHLFGQCAEMDQFLEMKKKYSIFLIEDAAQAMGSVYRSQHLHAHAGTMGDFGTTSFFPSKNLGCYGDGGAIFTNDDELSRKARMICNHGSKIKYSYEIIGINSRLDAVQAAILLVKLEHLDQDIKRRIDVAATYFKFLENKKEITLPYRDGLSTHTFHQFTIKVESHRQDIVNKLKQANISTAIYYPLSLHRQEAYQMNIDRDLKCPIADQICDEVLSLPIFPDLTVEQIEKITDIL